MTASSLPDHTPAPERADPLITHDQEHTSREEMTTQVNRLLDVTAAFSAALTPDQIAEVLLKQGITILDAAAGSLVIRETETRTLRIIKTIGYPEPLIEPYHTFPLDAALPIADAVRTNSAVWLENSTDWQQRYPHLPPIGVASSYQAAAALPLSIGPTALGGMGLSFTTERQFSTEEQAFATSLAQQAAQALDRALLYAQMQQRVEQRDAVALLSQQAISESLDALLDYAAASIARTLDVPLSSVFQFVPMKEVFRLHAGSGWQAELVGKFLAEGTQGSQLRYSIQSDLPVTSADLGQETRFVPTELLREFGVVSSLNVAIIGREPFGVLGAHTRTARAFSNDDTSFLQAVANIIAAASDRNTSEHERLLLERQLLEAQKLESLGVLAGGIAHDFNNLLVVILGNASLALLELAPEAPARESILQIEQTAQRAADLTHQMLAYAGKGRFDIRKINVSVLIEEMTHLLKSSVSKNAVLRYNLSQVLPAVEADPTQLRQVLMNLVVNASEAIGEKSGIITLSTGVMWVDRAYFSDTLAAPDLPEGTYVFLEVSDTGQGMSLETRTRIFEPFFTTKFTGRGLGLAAVIGIVRRHRGALRVYSELGHGTTFKVLLPSSEGSSDEVLHATASDETWQGSGLVLVIDDDDDVRRLVTRMLERSGFAVLTAPDGREGVRLFRTQASAIVCILLDMTMPHMSGDETFRELRRIRADIGVVLMSGYTEEEITGRFAGKGLAGFLHKPFTPQQLRTKLMAILGPPGG